MNWWDTELIRESISLYSPVSTVMTPDELTILREFEPSYVIVVGRDLENQENRTLLYGYTVDRETFHVYLRDGEIYTVIERKIHDTPNKPSEFRRELEQIQVGQNENYVPNKRIYPEYSDFEFCHLLMRGGIERLSFLGFNQESSDRFIASGKTYAAPVLPQHVIDSPQPDFN